MTAAAAPALFYPHDVDDPDKRAQAIRDPLLYILGPTKDNTVGDNNLLFLAFFYNQFGLFRDWPPFFNYYLTCNIHYVKDETGFNVMVACPKKENFHAGLISKQTPVPMPFPAPNDKCPMCQHSQVYWDAYEVQKKALGLDKMGKEAFFASLNANPALKRLRDTAKNWTPNERYYFGVYDMAKATGRKQLDDCDGGVVRVQGCFGPKTIFDDLELKRKMGRQFWDVHGGLFREVVVRRDNSDGARFCKYKLEVSDFPPNLSAEVVEYLKSNAVPDPYTFIKVWPAERMQAYIDSTAAAERDYVAGTGQSAGVTTAAVAPPPGNAPAPGFGLVPPPTPAAAPPPAAPVSTAPAPQSAAPAAPAAPAPPAALPVAAPPTAPPPPGPPGAVAAPAPAPPAAPASATPAAVPMAEPPAGGQRGKLRWR